MSEISERLRKARLASGHRTASGAAKAHGWAISTYIAHENGQNDYDAERAEVYAKAFKTTPEWLLLGKDNLSAGIDAQLRTLPPEDARRLIEKFSAMIEGVKIVGKLK